jgi:hypothetical protein
MFLKILSSRWLRARSRIRMHNARRGGCRRRNREAQGLREMPLQSRDGSGNRCRNCSICLERAGFAAPMGDQPGKRQKLADHS